VRTGSAQSRSLRMYGAPGTTRPYPLTRKRTSSLGHRTTPGVLSRRY
jgi:hypothetical protein